MRLAGLGNPAVKGVGLSTQLIKNRRREANELLLAAPHTKKPPLRSLLYGEGADATRETKRFTTPISVVAVEKDKLCRRV
jgi:hypothetical protein